MKRPIAATFLLFVLVSWSLAASPPARVNYQGSLRSNPGGVPESGNRDMVFHFFDMAAGGCEILRDSHTLAAGGSVSVSGGLFNVLLGSGTLSNPAVCPPNDPHITLDQVFRDFSDVFLEVEVGTEGGALETLTPRTRIVSAAYSLNADRLDGMNSSEFAVLAAANNFTNAGNIFNGDGAGLTNLNASNLSSGLVPDARIGGVYSTNAVTFSNALNSFTGSGAGLTGLNASNLSSGLVPDARIGGTYSSAVTFSNAANSFTGSGTGLTSLNASNLASGTVPSARISGIYSNPVTLNNSGNVIDGNIFPVAGTAAAPGLGFFSDNDTGVFSPGANVLAVTTAGTEKLRVDSGSLTYKNSLGTEEMKVFSNGDVTTTNRLFPSCANTAACSGAQGISFDTTNNRFHFPDSVNVVGNLTVTGAKPFVQNHPYRKDLSVVYVALEGDEAATYTRGTGRLVAGVARVSLGETFSWVTNPDIGLTAYLTPRGQNADLYVESLTTKELVVRSAGGSAADAAFDYIVYGLRIGFEEWGVVQPKKGEAPIPVATHFEKVYQDHPELLSQNPLERFKQMESAGGSARAVDWSASAALRVAIGEYDPETPPNLLGSGGAIISGLEGSTLTEAGKHEAPDRESEVAASRVSDGASAPPGVEETGHGAPSQKPPVPLIPDHQADLFPKSVRPTSGDLAGYYPVSELVELGDVVVMDREQPGKMRRGDHAADPAVVGIVSGEPGLVLGGGIARITAADPDLAREMERARQSGDKETEARLWSELEKKFQEAHAPVALSGIVLCKVDASYSAVQVGDLLTASPTPGHAMRSSDKAPGTILGKALESLESGTGLIKVLVMLR